MFDPNEIIEIKEKNNSLNNGERFVFTSLTSLIDFVHRYNTEGYYFRDQEGLWSVVSTFHCHYNTPYWERAYTISNAVVDWLLKNQYINTIIKNDVDIALVIAQHYGCPTDLIDITSTLETATYFTLPPDGIKNSKERLGYIWVFSPDDIHLIRRIMSSLQLESCNPYMIEKLRKNNYNLLTHINIPELSRLNAQTGSFFWDFGGMFKDVIRNPKKTPKKIDPNIQEFAILSYGYKINEKQYPVTIKVSIDKRPNVHNKFYYLSLKSLELGK